MVQSRERKGQRGLCYMEECRFFELALLGQKLEIYDPGEKDEYSEDEKEQEEEETNKESPRERRKNVRTRKRNTNTWIKKKLKEDTEFIWNKLMWWSPREMKSAKNNWISP
ncbi:MAG: hypothetical protein Ta2E_09430 [Mycoplasmoidaceae bacterium]|nr:MAG: hypothetical protein Ta2E_09430 [Mycoplasmoidaceae bacterium]